MDLTTPGNKIVDMGDVVEEWYYTELSEFLWEFGLEDGAPPAVWRGLAQAFATFSGYRVVLQAIIADPLVPAEAAEANDPDKETSGGVRYKDVVIGEPLLFVETVPE